MNRQTSPYVLRSVSLSDVIHNDEINLHPQNYCLVGGQMFRVRRNSEELKSQDRPEDLPAKMNHYENLVRSQKVEIDYQTERIKQLEDLLRSLNVDEAVIQRPFLFKSSHIEPSAHKFNAPTIELQRERSTTSEETDVETIVPPSTGRYSYCSSDYVTPKAVLNDSRFFPTPTHSNSPSSVDENQTEANSRKTNNIEPTESSVSPDRSALQNRLSSSTKERRKVLSTVCSSRSKLGTKSKIKIVAQPIRPASNEEAREPANSSFELSTTFPGACNPNAFQWKEKQECHLFIAHDNPQLHKNLLQFLDSSAQRQMHVMLESHENKEKAKFLFGSIVFSGSFHEIDGSNLSDLRGSLCLVVRGLYGVSGNLKSFQRRQKANHQDIVELHLTNRQKNKENMVQDEIPLPSDLEFHDITSEEDIKGFFRSCLSRVDVILDPYHDAFSWYPYYEGTRKMAPQFRSKGIGYLRLGDDMSNYGTAFLSLDAGVTYLDNGATNITNSKPQNSSTNQEDDCSVSSWKSTDTGKKKSLTNTIRKLVSTSRENSFQRDLTEVDKDAFFLRLQDCASQLSLQSKWTEKLKIVQRLNDELTENLPFLGSFLESCFVKDSRRSVLLGLCSAFSEQLSKNAINPKLLSELLKALEFLLGASPSEPLLPALVASASVETSVCKTLIADLLKLLKNSLSQAIQLLLQSVLSLCLPSNSVLSLRCVAELLADLFANISSLPASYVKIGGFLSQFLLQFYHNARATSGSSPAVPVVVFEAIVKAFLLLAQHRDEAVRDCAYKCLSLLVLLKVVAFGEVPAGSLASMIGASSLGDFQQTLVDHQLDPLASAFKPSWKGSEKVMQFCLQFLRETPDSKQQPMEVPSSSSRRKPLRDSRPSNPMPATIVSSTTDPSLANKWFESRLLFKVLPKDDVSWADAREVISPLSSSHLSISLFSSAHRSFSRRGKSSSSSIGSRGTSASTAEKRSPLANSSAC